MGAAMSRDHPTPSKPMLSDAMYLIHLSVCGDTARRAVDAPLRGSST